MNKYLIVMLLCTLTGFSQDLSDKPVPKSCKQLIIVITDSAKSTKGELVCFERKDNDLDWVKVGDELPVVIGKNGLGWGKGLNLIDSLSLPVKVEGDGRSPAGVFELGAAFGYATQEEMKDLKILYIHITENCECVDDADSRYYNKIVYRNAIADTDWESSEKMRFADIWYEQGVVINQNSNPVEAGNGSCIFLHNWSTPDETTAGCTEVEPKELTEIIFWLDHSANPIIVQLTKELYYKYQKSWELPRLDCKGE